MEQQTNHISSLVDKAKNYADTRMELVKLKVAEKSSQTIASIVSISIVVTIMLLFVVLLNIGLALWIGEMLGSNYYGFFVMAGFYGILALIIYSFKSKWIEDPVTNTIIKKMVN